jgi:RNA polymerase sigma-70 factor, ECF subfamily
VKPPTRTGIEVPFRAAGAGPSRPASPSRGAASCDRDLVDALLSGDEAAFLSLVESHHGTMIRIARCYVSSQSSAEDVAQEAWTAVLEGLGRWEGRGSLESWIYSIVANQARSRGARESRMVPFSAFGDPADDGGAAVGPDRFHPADHPHWPGWFRRPLDEWRPDQLESREILDRIRTAIDALPPAQRAVITMRDVAGRQADEACAALGISDVNQRVLLHRARSRVRAVVERCLDAESRP